MHQSPSQGSLLVNTGSFNGMKVFSASMMADRGQLGEKLTAWIESHPEVTITEITVTQSSDSSFHCLSFCVFYRTRAAKLAS